jgi:hypothetical protein
MKMIVDITITPPNSLVLITGSRDSIVPADMLNKLIASTSTCIAVGTRSETDGTTHIILTDEPVRVQADSRLHNIFAGDLETPNKVINVETVLLTSVAQLPVATCRSRLEIWVDDNTEPTKIGILVQKQP